VRRRVCLDGKLLRLRVSERLAYTVCSHLLEDRTLMRAG
jgi:hypothetical protein